LEQMGWPEVSFSDNSSSTVHIEACSRIYNGKFGLDWLVVAGQTTNCKSNSVFQVSGCVPCPAGSTAVMGRCVMCPPRHFESFGSGDCRACADGKQPNDAHSDCEICPGGQAGREGICQACKKLEGEVPSSDASTCVCPKGTYDSWDTTFGNQQQRRIYCWRLHSRSQEGPGGAGIIPAPQFDALNEPSKVDLEASFLKRCIACPDCITCPHEGGQVSDSAKCCTPHLPHVLAQSYQSRWQVAIKSGYNVNVGDQLPDGTAVVSSNDLNIYSCLNDGCNGFRFTVTSWSQTAMNNSCKPHYGGTLCSSCVGEFARSGKNCKYCGRVPWQMVLGIVLLVFVIVAVVALRFWRGHHPPDSHDGPQEDHELEGIAFYTGLLTQGVPGVPQDPFAPRRGPLGSSPDGESATGNAPTLVP
jgi:hypothetical protein